MLSAAIKRALGRLEDENGFTLIELLVVLIIIGLLAAIAIAAFTGQQDKAHDADAKTAARTAQIAMETYYVEHRSVQRRHRRQSSTSCSRRSRTRRTSRSSPRLDTAFEIQTSSVSTKPVTFSVVGVRKRHDQPHLHAPRARAAAGPRTW